MRIERSRVEPDRTGDITKMGARRSRSVRTSAGGRTSEAGAGAGFAAFVALPVVVALIDGVSPIFVRWNPVNSPSATFTRCFQFMGGPYGLLLRIAWILPCTAPSVTVRVVRVADVAGVLETGR